MIGRSGGTCRYCGARNVTVYPARHRAGGNYRRPHRAYRSSICLSCATALAEGITPGTLTTSQWDNHDLRDITEGGPAPRIHRGEL